MNIDIYTGGLAQTNGYLITTDTATVLIDAPDGIATWVKNKGITITHLLLTHQHWDHSHDVHHFPEAEIIAFADHSEDLIQQVRFRETYNIPLEVKPYTVTRKVTTAEKFTVGGLETEVLHVPGHSQDSIAFHIVSEKLCISGDVIMFNSVGRVDLPGGDGTQLRNSIENVLLRLPTDTILCPGHGPSSNVGDELEQNAYKSQLGRDF